MIEYKLIKTDEKKKQEGNVYILRRAKIRTAC